jgi:phosphoribosyl-AMP cyclohydrolase
MMEIKGDLVPAIVQDAQTGEVLMLAYMNREALAKTLETGKAHYWSRSRGKLWLKGESSGHFQKVVEARIDCDQDAILLKVRQEGGACHTGYRSCFYRDLEGNVVGEKVFDPDEVYR